MKRLALICILLFPLWLMPAVAYAQQTQVDHYHQKLAEQRAKVEGWDRTVGFTIGLTVLVGVLGIVAGLLQKGQGQAYKVATAVVGATISIITIVNNAVFTDDYRMLRHRVNEGRSIIDQIDLILDKPI